ncbi:MAG: GIY-YIG nuclease family protein [Nostoc sp. EkiNYC01]|nr:GIY-YIG nuclease family protein [Nostoc sp. EkiNYC01]
MVCGIYQISNTLNGKSYIGQSRNIYRRWKEHTRGLDKPNVLEIGSYPLRYAFLKYELKEVVATPGKTGLFDFKVIEECTEDKLLERERFWIDKIDPEYNCNIWTPARKKKEIDSETKFWVQYHNYNVLGYVPVEMILDESLIEKYEHDEVLPGISTNKRAVLNTVGDTFFLIVGIGSKPKQYYLWSKFICEEIVINDYENSHSYNAFGTGYLIDPPQLLNSKQFNKFKKFCGNFGFGFMRIKESSEACTYLSTLKDITENYKPKNSKLNFSQYIKDFYTQVTRVNPNEYSAYHQRGFYRHLAVSLSIEEALGLLMDEYTTLVIFDPINHELNYKNSKLLIHTLDFSSSEEGKKYIDSYEFNDKTFPSYAIVGWMAVEKIFKYDEKSFAADKDLHLLGESLLNYKNSCGYEGSDVWGIVLKKPIFLNPPISNVLQPEGINNGELWGAEDLSHLEAFDIALQAKVEYE